MRIAITGAGNVGRSIARELIVNGHQVLLIDKEPAAIKTDSVPEAEWLLADACELSSLEEAGLDSCDVAIAATGDGKANLAHSLLAKTEFGVPRMVARVNHPRNEWMFDEVWGVDVSVSTPRIMSALVEEAVTIGGVSFVGATLWTDYRIEGHHRLAMSHARERMNDHRQIALQRNPWQRFVPEMAARIHHVSRQFIEESLRAARIPTVVVTHHLPHPASLPDRFKGDLLNAAYASDLSQTIERGRPALWVHGHTHDSCDYHVGETRIVCNPGGYDNENGRFHRQMVVEVSTGGLGID